MQFAQRPYEEGGLGLAKHQAAGLVGNLQTESGAGLPAWGPTGDNRTAWGTAQWREDRLDALKRMYPDTYQTPEAQMQFMRHELSNSESKAYKAIQAATSPEEAARAWDRHYERSDGSAISKRAANARALYGSDLLPDAGAAPGTGYIPKKGPGVPALSPDNTMGPGALAMQPEDPWDRRAEGLSQIGAAIAGIVNPAQAAAINNSILLNKKGAKAQGTWSSHVLPNGQVMQTHSLTGQTRMLDGNYAKPADQDDPLKPFGDVTKQGEEYLTSLDPQQQQLVKGIANGSIPPLSSYALAKPEGQRLMAAVAQYEPGFDAAKWQERSRMAKDIGGSGPSTIGGIISNGKSAFDHLATTSDRLVDVGNTNSGSYPGAGVVNSVSNWTGNKLADSKQQARITAATDALQKYGAESTKFYAGSGGGVHERAEALKANDPATNSGEQSASYIEVERDLMLGRLKEKEDQIRKSMGQAYLDKHPVRDEAFEKTLAKINANIERLRAGGKQKAAPDAHPADKRPSLDSIFN